MKLISWNVAGLRACLNKGFADFFYKIDADVFCVQEVKAERHQIMFEPFGYYEYLYPAEKKGYSGTLIYSKQEPISVKYGIGIEKHDHEGRVITVEFERFYVITVYVPNVKRDLSRLEYRMEWEDDFVSFLKELEKTKPVVVCGDFNVAHNEIDIRNSKQNIGNAGFTYEEREKFSNLLSNGFIDTFRHLYPEKVEYSWWSYIGNSRLNNVGWRIDYFIISKKLKTKLKNATIYTEVTGSDHCPVGIEIEE